MSVNDETKNVLPPVGVFGTYEDGLKFIGYQTGRMKADIPLDLSVMYALLGIVHDNNPNYWDTDLSELLWEHRIAPSSLLLALFAPLRWSPKPSGVGMVARMTVPLPGSSLINVGSEEFFYRPLRVGDWLSRTETVVSISPEKKTGIGVGHFVTTRMDYYDQDDLQVASGMNTLFRFTPLENSGEGQ